MSKKQTFRQRISNLIYPAPEAPKKETFRFVMTGATWISRDERNLNDVLTAIQSAERETFKDKKPYYDIVQECTEYDAHLFSLLQRRTQNITGRVIQYTDAAGQVNEELTKIFNKQQFKSLLSEIVGSLYFGHTLIQFGEQPFDHELIDRRLVDGDKKVVYTSWLNRKPHPYIDDNGELFNNLLEIGNAYDLGIIKQALTYSVLKRNLLGDWAMYSQKAGNNFEKVVYKGDKLIAQQVSEAFANAGAGAAIPIPEGVIDIQSISSASSQQNELFENFYDRLNSEESKLILGQTMTTENGSSYSQSYVHLSQQELIFESDAEWVLSILNSKAFKRILNYFRIDSTGAFQFENRVISVADEIEKDLKLKELGVVFPVGYLNKKYGVEVAI